MPSDLEQMPHLLELPEERTARCCLEHAHADDRAHRRRQPDDLHRPVRRPARPAGDATRYKTYNPDGSTDPATSFAYWTSPVVDTKTTPTAGHDRPTPSMVYSRPRPGDGRRHRQGHARRRGCRSPAPAARSATSRPRTWCWRTPAVDIPTVFGPDSPEARRQRRPGLVQGRRDRRLHRRGGPLRPGRRDLRERPGGEVRQTTPSPTRSDCCRPSRAATTGTRRCSAHKYVAPQLGGGTPNLTHNGYQVTDANGNLVDLDGNEIHEPFTRHSPGSPGSARPRRRRWPYMADMQEAGIPVTYGYISDLHERKAGHRPAARPAAGDVPRAPLGPGDACYVDERPGTTTRRSRRSSTGSPPTASRRRTRCS